MMNPLGQMPYVGGVVGGGVGVGQYMAAAGGMPGMYGGSAN